MQEMSWRLSSSGNGVRLLPPVRRPASRCITGMRRWKAARAAASAELVSPCTRMAIGYCPEITCGAVAIALPSSSNHSRAKSSKRPMTAATRSFSRERASPAHSSTSVVIPARSKISRTMRWCWPVETTTGRRHWLSRRARITGATLIASGRVPTTTGTANLVASGSREASGVDLVIGCADVTGGIAPRDRPGRPKHEARPDPRNQALLRSQISLRPVRVSRSSTSST